MTASVGAPRRVLITGGTGFLGSHTALAVLAAGRDVVLLDNLDNSRAEVADQVGSIAGVRPRLVVADVRDRASVTGVLREERIDAVIHFAGRKAVAESVADPLPYFDHNVAGTVALLLAMRDSGVRSLVFSSSAAVYAPRSAAPAREGGPLAPASPYGLTKRMVEEVLATACSADPAWRIVALRYFNPVGAHESGRLGEQSSEVPSNLMPIVLEAAAGRRTEVEVYGGDYDTPDGTAIRDYVHVMDLAEAHLAALDWRSAQASGGLLVANIGTGRGTTVLELLAAFRDATGVAVPHRIVGRRAGDPPASWADPSVAERELGWRARRDLAAMCRDAWRWEQARVGARGEPGSAPRVSAPGAGGPAGAGSAGGLRR